MAQAWPGAGTGPYAQRLRGIEEAELLQARQPLPVGLRFGGRLDPLSRVADGEEMGECAVEPKCELAYRGIDADQRGLGQALPQELCQEGSGHGDEPLLGVVMAVELLLEGQRAIEVTALGVAGGLGLIGHFGGQVESGQIPQTISCCCGGGRDVME